MELKMIRRHHVACYTTDQTNRLKLASLLDFAQDMAGDHADILGFGNDMLLEKRIVWILSRIKVKMDEYPLWREDIVITTWHRGLEGPFYVRDYEINSIDGRRLGVITSSWLLLDVDERKLIRSEIATEEEKICHDVALAPVAGKIRLPKGIGMTECGSHTVGYSDIDKNGHANNVKYTVWAMDALDRQFVTENPVREYEINFNKEAMPDGCVTLRKGMVETEDGIEWYVEGYVKGQQSFICRLKF